MPTPINPTTTAAVIVTEAGRSLPDLIRFLRHGWAGVRVDAQECDDGMPYLCVWEPARTSSLCLTIEPAGHRRWKCVDQIGGAELATGGTLPLCIKLLEATLRRACTRLGQASVTASLRAHVMQREEGRTA